MDRVKGKDPLSSGASWLFGKGVWLSAYNQTTLGLVMSCLHRCRSDFRRHQKERGGGGVGDNGFFQMVFSCKGPGPCFSPPNVTSCSHMKNTEGMLALQDL